MKEDQELKDSVSYIACLRTVWTICANVSEKKKSKLKKTNKNKAVFRDAQLLV